MTAYMIITTVRRMIKTQVGKPTLNFLILLALAISPLLGKPMSGSLDFLIMTKAMRMEAKIWNYDVVKGGIYVVVGC